jgi:curved DNA-binding protein CbpA
VEEREKNYYEVLEVPVDASMDEIQHGYIRARNAYSTDSLALYSLMSQDECDNILEVIEEAYVIVSDPEKRRRYDYIRGFNQNRETETVVSAHNTAQRKAKSEEESRSTNKISKLVANKKFSLEYDRNMEFENEIESTTEFTGSLLKKIREYKNVDLVRLADLTKVSKTYLAKIEEEDTNNLPALVYVRGFVYQYAKCLKLNPDLVATSYLYRLKKIVGENSELG